MVDDEPFSALAFKVMSDPYVGRLTFFRVYSGVLKAGSYVYNATKGQRTHRSHSADARQSSQEIEECYAGRDCRSGWLEITSTGDSLCTEDNVIMLEVPVFPEPVIDQAVEPKTKSGSG